MVNAVNERNLSCAGLNERCALRLLLHALHSAVLDQATNAHDSRETEAHVNRAACSWRLEGCGREG